jgi:hypothetical protein
LKVPEKYLKTENAKVSEQKSPPEKLPVKFKT